MASTSTPKVWEGEYRRDWDGVVPDDQERRAKIAAEHEATRKLLSRRTQRQQSLYYYPPSQDGDIGSPSTEAEMNVRRGLNRHLVIITDLSKNGELTDYRPCRAHVLLTELASFVEAYFDQNPISQLSVIGTHHSIAKKMTELSGNAAKHLSAIKTAPKLAGGEPSLENALRVAYVILNMVPRCGTREILIGYVSLTTCDPGDIYQAVDLLEEAGIQVSILGLGAEVRICKYICEKTHGKYQVALDKDHLHELLLGYLPPPVQYTNSKIEPALIKMGFPYQTAAGASLCSCHREIRAGGFECPQCRSKYCELPVCCTVCGLNLISSPQLARSYHHLFPIPMFILHTTPFVDSTDDQTTQHNIPPTICLGCAASIVSTQPKFECPSCHHFFCFGCDELIHESLHVCPGCEGCTTTL